MRPSEILRTHREMVLQIIAAHHATNPRVIGARVLKLPRFAAAGVAHCWLIDPDIRTLEAYANQDDRWLLLGTWGGDDVANIDPFAAIPLSLAGLWVD